MLSTNNPANTPWSVGQTTPNNRKNSIKNLDGMLKVAVIIINFIVSICIIVAAKQEISFGISHWDYFTASTWLLLKNAIVSVTGEQKVSIIKVPS